MTKPSSLGQGALEAKERVVHSGAVLEQVFQDVRFGLRLLRREPGFTATTVLTLTLAIHDHLLGRRRGAAPTAAVSGT